MYRILIADDEGIMVESLREIILRQYKDVVEIATAKTGRTAIEQAENFHPDIVFMDIQMPGINGIAAIREIRSFNSSCLFYVISAYEKFDYAQDAISLGVEQYIMKPVSRDIILKTVSDAMKKVDRIREKRSDQLKIQEKLETIMARENANTRMRDFYDIHALAERKPIDYGVLREAFLATSRKRETTESIPRFDTILESVRTDSEMGAMWERYRKENYFVGELSWDEVNRDVKELKEKALG